MTANFIFHLASLLATIVVIAYVAKQQQHIRFLRNLLIDQDRRKVEINRPLVVLQRYVLAIGAKWTSAVSYNRSEIQRIDISDSLLILARMNLLHVKIDADAGLDSRLNVLMEFKQRLTQQDKQSISLAVNALLKTDCVIEIREC
jgi:hypothetical protein